MPTAERRKAEYLSGFNPPHTIKTYFVRIGNVSVMVEVGPTRQSSGLATLAADFCVRVHRSDMSANSEKTQLTPSTVDYVTAAAKAALGAIPFAGSLLVELAGTFIPNQRIDRITKFAIELEARLANLEKDYIRSELSDERFSDLLEEGLRQAARSLTDERRRYIAALITNSLSSPDIEYHESRHLLRILNDLNDLEVIWLRFYLHPTISGDKEFRSKHEAILSPVFATMGSSQDVLDKSSLQDSYKPFVSIIVGHFPPYSLV